jgi:hypothetical protein
MPTKPLQSVILRRLAGVAACVLFAAFASTRSLSISPPGMAPRQFQVAGAQAHVFLDSPSRVVGNGAANSNDFDALWRRAVLLGNLATSDPVLEYVGRIAGIDPRQIAGVTRITANVPTVMTEPDSERRADQIAADRKPYRLDIQPSQNLSTLNVFTQAPSVPEAQRLADAVVPALTQYLRDLALKKGADPSSQVQLTQTGRARVGMLGSGKKMVAGLTFMLAFGLSAALLAIISRRRRRPGPAIEEPDEAEPEPAAPGRRLSILGRPADRRPLPSGYAAALAAPMPAVALRRPSLALPRVRRTTLRRRLVDDWPHTTRLLPWTLAVMLAVIWLVPFNSIVLNVSLPIDLKFDRLVLPFVVIAWVLGLALGGRGAPRVKLTTIHLTIAAVLIVACLSLILDASYLSFKLELLTGIKRLVLLGSYATLFIVAASSLRSSEVPAFLKYTLLLAIVCALGTIWEYRFHYNFFYEMSAKLLPGIFQVSNDAESSAVDEIGRRIVRGPAEVPLEAVAMMAMALPIALVGILHANVKKERILYGIAACILLAAMISTFRKSAFMAPIAVVLTIGYFRRRELLRLTPLLLVMLVVLHVVSPGALGSIAFQLRGDHLDVNTVNDRTSDYDAVRPDIWSHPVFGRGYGTYEHKSYRILDMELLRETVEVGAVGVAAYLLMILSVIAVARAPIRARRPRDAPVALVAAAAAVAFLVVSTLFDVMSFPHCPYIFLWMAAMLSATVTADDPEPPGEPQWSS